MDDLMRIEPADISRANVGWAPAFSPETSLSAFDEPRRD